VVRGPLTLTHARLRWMQGDLRGARSLISAILLEHPEDPEARAWLCRLEEPREAASVADAGAAERPGVARRVARLRSWLQRLERCEY
jgi:hypothetical protein